MRLSSEVTKVAFDDSDHILTVELVNQLDGNISNLTCNHVIWTTSVGYLKENFQKIFSSEPDLIHQKQSSIENLGFGTANKVILVYDAPISFWPDNTADLHPLISVNQTKYSLNKGERAFLTEQNVDPSQAQFVLDGVLCVSPSVSMRFVIVWIVGEAALAAESFNELVLAYLCHNIFLSRYLNGAVDNQKPSRAIIFGFGFGFGLGLQLPKYDVDLFGLDLDLGFGCSGFGSYWNKNRFERGSYSYLSVRASLDDRDRLRQSYTPDGIPRVVFAGEATHSHYSSSVHGAYESGINAVQILRQYLETASDCRK
ncbi:unnamed protein product [Rotaria magnacalcarata]|uniref:Amine oxidase domain-containing protein n=3 Tax=Rotaria magnacalcarata TaxID=392030 RepID=A0A820HF30_9BILA|nr:unnamed protein product [Rotaria magnacalcarata]